jgi:hypothetical protein
MMVADLTAAGLVEARLWGSTAPWIESVRAARPYWRIRSFSFVPIAAGFAALFAGMLTGRRGDERGLTEDLTAVAAVGRRAASEAS